MDKITVKFVFVDQFGCFASVVLAGYCLGMLSPQVNYREILNLPYFAEQEGCQPGRLYYIGKDQGENEYYTLGVGRYGHLITSVAWPEMLKISQVKEKVILYDVSSFNSLPLNLLEVLSRGKLRRFSKYVWAYWFVEVLRQYKRNFV